MPKLGRIAGLVGLGALAGGEMQQPPFLTERSSVTGAESVAHAAPPDKPTGSETPAPNRESALTKPQDGPKSRRFKEILADKNTPALQRLRELEFQLKGTVQTMALEKASNDPTKDVYRKGETEYVWEVIDAMFKLLHSTPGPQRKELRKELEEYAKYFRHQENRIELANEIEERLMDRLSPRQRAGKKKIK